MGASFGTESDCLENGKCTNSPNSPVCGLMEFCCRLRAAFMFHVDRGTRVDNWTEVIPGVHGKGGMDTRLSGLLHVGL